MLVIILKQTFKIKLKLFISQPENDDINWSPYLKEQIECAADIGDMRKCTIKMNLLRDSLENRFCDFAKEVHCIFTFIKPFSLSEQQIMKMPNNIQMELLDFKTNLILKTIFKTLSSVPGTYDVINFWRSLPCENFPELRNFAQSYMYAILKWRTHANKHFCPWLNVKRARAWLIQNWRIFCCSQ